MTRWYGRIASLDLWQKSSRNSLADLIQDRLPGILQKSSTTFWVEANPVPRRVDGRNGFLETRSITVPLDQIEWIGGQPRPDSCAIPNDSTTATLVRVAAFHANGRGIAGACLLPGGTFSLNELSHLLWAHYGSGMVRQGGLTLACSSEKPLPELWPSGPFTPHLGASVFQCENPICIAFQRPVLVPSGFDLLDGNRIGAIAFPCPKCSGGWYERWALTWLRRATPSDLRLVPTVHYPVQPTEQRRNGLTGPLANIVRAERRREPWGWHPTRMRVLTKSFRRFLKTSEQNDLVKAMREDPVQVGDILTGILHQGNLRAFVDYVRSLPVESRLQGIPTALSHAFCPNRPSAYHTLQDAIQMDHHFYIAYDPDRFMRYLHYLGVADICGALLDIGSGIGEKPFIAYACGHFDRCDGLEYDPKTFAVSQFLLEQIQTDHRYPIQYQMGDALRFPSYQDYDVIYMYRPMRDRNMMRELFRKIGMEMKIGSLCMDIFQKNLAFRRVNADMYAIPSAVDSEGPATWEKHLSLDETLSEIGYPDIRDPAPS